MSFKFSDEEEKYYREKRLRELKDAQREKQTEEELDKIKEGLAEKVHIDDDEILDDLVTLGFTEDTVGVLPLVPLISVAWADGDVSSNEAKRILEVAEKRGVEKEGGAYNLLESLLVKQPTKEFLHSCIYVLREVYEALDPDDAQRAKENLLGFSRVVAKASGGVLGLFGNKVSEEEESLIDDIAQWLGVSEDSASTKSLHDIVAAEKEDSGNESSDDESSEEDED